ncbi:unnamed protein product [Neospora caninum Liverpool]|uniref:Uncharacterized protein n=1 Tax=Neospora caninum (strain Liverpool) TaxID=572307 RepID=F0VAW5_NEOCL|nr:uncharacterized protein NCLIV_038975 [Neospora caninum Liverpool]CBZ50823.1 unnamed protein product [Neospora caninum Liverpool]CEL68124.1 TPA: hypothetical protein BN1204_038975_1 [Neospora caninum Liverpool]|eukprot:XP_003880856.1 uncharacterized protein NCLIV_038975 [Neospora caninum Liverpool]
MAKRLGRLLSDIFIIKPTGFTSWITYASVTYLGYVWYVDGRCPFLPSKESDRQSPLPQDAEQLVQDPAEERLIRELGLQRMEKARLYSRQSRQREEGHRSRGEDVLINGLGILNRRKETRDTQKLHFYLGRKT